MMSTMWSLCLTHVWMGMTLSWPLGRRTRIDGKEIVPHSLPQVILFIGIAKTKITLHSFPQVILRIGIAKNISAPIIPFIG